MHVCITIRISRLAVVHRVSPLVARQGDVPRVMTSLRKRTTRQRITYMYSKESPLVTELLLKLGIISVELFS